MCFFHSLSLSFFFFHTFSLPFGILAENKNKRECKIGFGGLAVFEKKQK